MTSRTAALRYARALFDVAVKEQANLSAIEEQLTSFVDLFRGSPRTLAKVLLNPAVPAVRKRATVVELLKRAQMSPVLEKLLLLLAERDRLVILPEVLAAGHRQRLLDHQNVVRAEITTATPLSADRTQAIERDLAKATGRHVRLAALVDPSIIGGIVTRIGSTVYDGSITGQLRKMKERLDTHGH